MSRTECWPQIQIKPAGGNLLGYTYSQINLKSLKMQRAKHGLHGVRQSQQPEEQNLLLDGDPLNPSKSRYILDGEWKSVKFYPAPHLIF